MTEDIVTRLRKDFDEKRVYYKDLEIAINEIERLRRLIQLMSIDYRTQIAGMEMRCVCGSRDV